MNLYCRVLCQILDDMSELYQLFIYFLGLLGWQASLLFLNFRLGFLHINKIIILFYHSYERLKAAFPFILTPSSCQSAFSSGFSSPSCLFAFSGLCYSGTAAAPPRSSPSAPAFWGGSSGWSSTWSGGFAQFICFRSSSFGPWAANTAWPILTYLFLAVSCLLSCFSIPRPICFAFEGWKSRFSWPSLGLAYPHSLQIGGPCPSAFLETAVCAWSFEAFS